MLQIIARIARHTLCLFATALFVIQVEGSATAGLAIHYAPAENLERVDVALIETAARSIDFCAYLLTDYPVIDALARAAKRGVVVRIYRDGSEPARALSEPYRAMATTPGLTIHVKRSSTYMHLKSYAVDGRTLRTGAANFSPSGLKRQDNDLVITDDAGAVAAFEANFDRIWAEGEASTQHHPTDRAD